MDRVILHSDMNCFYASVEMLYHPELAGLPVAVGGDPEARHGIVLTANYIAKRAGVKTGMALWQAREACRDVIFVPPRMDLYLRFSRLAREIYADYTDLQESYGIDENWLDVTRSAELYGSGLDIAKDISRRIKSELGLTVSIGVSWNKIFAKFGSDYKKPDAITVINRTNYQQIVWTRPVSDLLYVGRATDRKLHTLGIDTIGQLAQTDPEVLASYFGKIGYVLSAFARGEDQTPVISEDYHAPVKSIGNSTTTPRDLVNEEDVRLVVYLLSESVASRLREHGFQCNVVEINVRDNELFHFTKQRKMNVPTDISGEIAAAAMQLFRESYRWQKPIRSIGVRACQLVSSGCPVQLDLFHNEEYREKLYQVDLTVDQIRSRFGYDSIRRGLMYRDRVLSRLDAKTQTVHPHGYFENGNHTGIPETKTGRR